MRSTLLLGVFFLFISFVSAQEPIGYPEIAEMDSVLQIVPDSTNTDTITTDTVSAKELINEYISKAQYQKAIILLDSLNFSEKEFRIQKAYCFQSLNNYRKAIDILFPLKDEYPEDISIKQQLILCYESINEYRKANEILEELIILQPENSYFQVRKGDMLYRDDNPKAALAAYQGVSEYNTVYLNKRIGMCFEKINQNDSAGVYYSKAWEADLSDVFSAISLVKMQLKEENYETALQNSEFFLKNNPDNLQMRVLNAYSYYSLENYPEAMSRFEHCRELGDSSLITTRGLGISYFFLQNDSLAYPNLSAAYAMDTTNSVVLHALGATALNIGVYPTTIDAYTRLLDRLKVEENTYYTYHKGLADGYYELGDYQNATGNYLICLRHAHSPERIMNLNYAVASIAEEKLDDFITAIFYYSQYLKNLSYYKLTLDENEDTLPETLEELDFKIEELKKHIELLKSKDTTIKWNN